MTGERRAEPRGLGVKRLDCPMQPIGLTQRRPSAPLAHPHERPLDEAEEAGALGQIEPRHFHLYIHSKGVFWQPGGVQEFVVKAFLMEIHQMRKPEEANRKPTWFSPEEAKKRLAKGREVKYFHELEAVIDRALERIQFHSELWGTYPGVRASRPFVKDPIAAAVWP